MARGGAGETAPVQGLRLRLSGGLSELILRPPPILTSFTLALTPRAPPPRREA
jgi:hypothetical protein